MKKIIRRRSIKENISESIQKDKEIEEVDKHIIEEKDYFTGYSFFTTDPIEPLNRTMINPYATTTTTAKQEEVSNLDDIFEDIPKVSKSTDLKDKPSLIPSSASLHEEVIRRLYKKSPIREGEEETMQNPLSYAKSKKQKVNNISEEAFRRFLQDNTDIYSLFDTLIKSNILSITSNIFNIERLNRNRGRRTTGDTVSSWIEREREYIKNMILTIFNYSFTEADTKTLDRLLSIITNDEVFDIYIGSGEMLRNIIDICKNKGIMINDDIKKMLSLDFFNLRKLNKCIRIFYSSNLMFLLLISDEQQYYEDNELIIRFIHHIEGMTNFTFTKDNYKIVDVITINNKEYSKDIFESLIETTTENFIRNLEIETFISKTDVVVDKMINDR